jgi:hypothetical protein
MAINNKLIKVTFFVFYYIGIISLSIIPVLIIINLDYETQKNIFENIFGGDAGIGGYGLFFLYDLIFIISVIVLSIISFLILNKLTKKYSNKIMVIIASVFIISTIIIFRIIILFGIIPYIEISIIIFSFFPLILLLSYKKQK